MDKEPPKPTATDLPAYVIDPLKSQSPDRLEVIAKYAGDLAAWKRSKRDRELKQKQAEEAIDTDELEALEERDISVDPDDCEDIPSSGAYITIKETKPGYHYYYWQWRDGNSWKNEYIGPVNPQGSRS